ncbi:MAG: uroporphyrinogen decarboxylase family protein [Phycisphaerales bacterium JB038]
MHPTAALPPRDPDFEQFLRVLERRERPAHLPFYEHLASHGFIAARLGISVDELYADQRRFWEHYVEFWKSLRFDCIPLEIPLNCPLADAGAAGATFGSEARAVIHSRADFDAYPWPEPGREIDFQPFEIVSALLPDGMKIVAGVAMGPFEWVSEMMGVAGLCRAVLRDPALVEVMFERLGALIVAANRHLVRLPEVGAMRQGDDLGFKTSTFLSPDLIRQLILPVYRDMAAVAHEAGKPFILHSCGNLEAIYDDLIDDVGIDAKHSFEETILPVEAFKARYGDRVTPLGGIDVDLLCRGDEAEIRHVVRAKIDACFADRFYALGTGNSLTDYMPVQNYLIALEEAWRYTS